MGRRLAIVWVVLSLGPIASTAFPSLASDMSTAMIGDAAMSRAPMIAESPTPSTPITRTPLAAATGIWLSVMPITVTTAQPTIATISDGTSSTSGPISSTIPTPS